MRRGLSRSGTGCLIEVRAWRCYEPNSGKDSYLCRTNPGGSYCCFLCMCMSKPTLLRGSSNSFVVFKGDCGLFFLFVSEVCLSIRAIQSTAMIMKALPFVLSHGWTFLGKTPLVHIKRCISNIPLDLKKGLYQKFKKKSPQCWFDLLKLSLMCVDKHQGQFQRNVLMSDSWQMERVS